MSVVVNSPNNRYRAVLTFPESGSTKIVIYDRGRGVLKNTRAVGKKIAEVALSDEIEPSLAAKAAHNFMLTLPNGDDP